MKSLGKHTVTVDSFLNDEPTVSFNKECVVYEKKDGTDGVNHMTSKRQVERLPSGAFRQRFDVRTIRKATFDDILAGRV